MSSFPYLRTEIDTGWTFKQADASDQEFLPVAQFPTTIHLDLLHHKRIPKPTQDRNSDKVQWIGEKKWLYKTSFYTPKPLTQEGGIVSHVLVFDGLDTYATVTLNGHKILDAANMFLQYRVDVTDKLREDGPNELTILFDSAFLVGKRLEKEQGYKNLFWNGDSCRMNVRKIACHFGWDWGPTLLTCGPWRPIYLESFTARITDLSVDIAVNDGLDAAEVNVAVELEGKASKDAAVEVAIADPEGKLVSQAVVQGSGSCSFTIKDPQLWYPIGYGKQPLYSVSAAISGGHKKPITEKPGKTFFFQINKIPIYCRGSNWIPGDTFVPRLTPARYRQWIELAASGNQNMIRVWGGGLYEDDAFYDICDEKGILVWQDFMLGCGVYPVNDFMLSTIRAEAEYNIRRMRHHPCIVLWCGNNEDHMFAELHHLEYDINDKNPENWLKTNWAARYYYDKMLPDICAELVPRVPYHNSSPYGGSYSNDPTEGDIHSWRVWMADQPRYPYQDYEKLTGRFVSEFGMKSYPAVRSIKQLITDPKERHPQSRTFDLWHFAPEDQRTIAMYLIDNQRHGYSLEETVVEHPENEFTKVFIRRTTYADIWASNVTTEPVNVELTVSFFSVIDGTKLSTVVEDIHLPANRSIELKRIQFSDDWGVPPESVVVFTKLTKNNEIVARYVEWPQPLRHLDLSVAKVHLRKQDTTADNKLAIFVTVEGGVAKGVELRIDTEDPALADACQFSDNCLDLVPGEGQCVFVTTKSDSGHSVDSIKIVEQHYGGSNA
ncbi:Glycoside hydrolase family 2 protein [Rasamsonia emersonii CBS 393.64]|uniref:Beta-mannosidase B n=1 Tax=Rasamsonia emersonii (strain ATCC 16479 / CBS 393.64 / IMI 116815) TaxID=1408163 RepID=A0A0F4YTL0_RASE3|nr:Glycoside hydrolase family 2 protein [Rasamsonia emersonii CBS 393.64]KKA20968.1 Glycoside hydrolase family 2 protein [Rasamsonia emersonii CBS 393.64]